VSSGTSLWLFHQPQEEAPPWPTTASSAAACGCSRWLRSQTASAPPAARMASSARPPPAGEGGWSALDPSCRGRGNAASRGCRTHAPPRSSREVGLGTVAQPGWGPNRRRLRSGHQPLYPSTSKPTDLAIASRWTASASAGFSAPRAGLGVLHHW